MVLSAVKNGSVDVDSKFSGGHFSVAEAVKYYSQAAIGPVLVLLCCCVLFGVLLGRGRAGYIVAPSFVVLR